MLKSHARGQAESDPAPEAEQAEQLEDNAVEAPVVPASEKTEKPQNAEAAAAAAAPGAESESTLEQVAEDESESLAPEAEEAEQPEENAVEDKDDEEDKDDDDDDEEDIHGDYEESAVSAPAVARAEAASRTKSDRRSIIRKFQPVARMLAEDPNLRICFIQKKSAHGVPRRFESFPGLFRVRDGDTRVVVSRRTSERASTRPRPRAAPSARIPNVTRATRSTRKRRRPRRCSRRAGCTRTWRTTSRGTSRA